MAFSTSVRLVPGFAVTEIVKDLQMAKTLYQQEGNTQSADVINKLLIKLKPIKAFNSKTINAAMYKAKEIAENPNRFIYDRVRAAEYIRAALPSARRSR